MSASLRSNPQALIRWVGDMSRNRKPGNFSELQKLVSEGINFLRFSSAELADLSYQIARADPRRSGRFVAQIASELDRRNAWTSVVDGLSPSEVCACLWACVKCSHPAHLSQNFSAFFDSSDLTPRHITSAAWALSEMQQFDLIPSADSLMKRLRFDDCKGSDLAQLSVVVSEIGEISDVLKLAKIICKWKSGDRALSEGDLVVFGTSFAGWIKKEFQH